MERSSRDHLKGREGWSHSHRGIKTDQDTMIGQGMSAAERTRSEGPIGDRRGM